VERSRDFKPIDAETKADKLVKTYFGANSIPATEETKANVAAAVHDLLGVDYDEEGVQDAVEDQEGRRSQRASAGGFGISQ